MDKLLFGISGLPIGDESIKKFNYASGIKYLSSLGLDAMELPFVRSVNVTEKNKSSILEAKDKYKFYLSAHGSYYINLNAQEYDKVEKSKERILKGAAALSLVGGRSLVFHPGYYLNSNNEETFINICNQLNTLPHEDVDYRLETTGKPTQFGSYKELIEVCKQVPSCKLCIDFAHIHARENGILKDYEDFAKILTLIKEELGQAALDDLHIHVAGINYGEKGEKNHLPLLESDFNYIDLLTALKDYKVKGCLICESPILEKDALLLKETYYKL